MPPRRSARSRTRAAVAKAAETTVPNETVGSTTSHDDAIADIKRMIDAIEAQVEERIGGIMSAAEDAILSLRNSLKTKIVRLPKKTRDMPLKEFQEKYPEDFKSGALKEIKERYSAMAEAAQQSVPIALANGRKRGPEPVTVLRTVRARRGAMAGNVLQDVNRSISEENQVATQSEFGMTNKSETNSKMVQMHAETDGSHPQLESISEDAEPTVFNAMPLQTPLPFSGAAMALPVTMVAQRRGGRTKAAPAPDAIVISTADGKQWALGKDGLEGIPESHRAEVAEMLQSQFQFLSAALGKTVFERPGGRATRRR